MRTEAEVFFENFSRSGLYGSDYEQRRMAIEKFGFPVITEEAVKAIMQYGPRFLEVGSGLGYLSYLLQQAGADVIATDKCTVDHSRYQHVLKPKNYWLQPKILEGRRAVKRYHERTLVMSWPCYNDHWAYKVLRESRCQYFVYIGEDRWGCTATDKFFDLLADSWESIPDIPRIPQWDGIHDELMIYKRK